MPNTNTYFSSTTGYTGEQQLVDNLVIEQIGMFGVDLLYMPRENVNLDRLLHEATKDVFQLAMSIPMYIKSFDGYDNGIEMLSKFGVRSSDELTLVMSRSQWSTYYAPWVKSMYNAQSDRPELAQNNKLEGQTARRPKEGDLIFFPFDAGIFEIKYVMFDQPFFQLGKGYIYELQCEKFEYSGEDFATGHTEIDSLVQRGQFYTLELEFDEGGSNSFDFQETVRIYNISDVDPANMVTISGDNMLDDNYAFLDADGVNVFKFYDDPGILKSVPIVEATVTKWDAPSRKLQLMNLTDLNPDQFDTTTYTATKNPFERCIVIGSKSGARWISNKAAAAPKAFDDAAELQKEFDTIKVYDPIDASPFGFY